jgi:hypothetical protein
VVRHTLRYFWTRRQFFALLHDPAALPPALARSYLKQRLELSKMISTILLDGIEDGALRAELDTRLVAESLLGMLRGINRYCRDYTTPEAATDAVVSMFLDGCATRPRLFSVAHKR